jgi:isopentenyl-diphosphate delta-isomerase
VSGDRKDSHLALCLEEGVEPSGRGAAGFAALRFEHDALPELDLEGVRTGV